MEPACKEAAVTGCRAHNEVTVFSQWPLQHFFDYTFSFDSIVSNLQYPRECQGELWIVVRGDALPCGGSPYINWMLHDATVTIQAIRPYGLGMFSGDLLEGSNRLLKDIWSSFCDRGGGAGTLVSRRIKMLRQVNEGLFLYFEVPRWNRTSRSNLCNAQKLADDVRAYFADEKLW